VLILCNQNNLKLEDVVTIVGEQFIIVGLIDTARVGQVANANLYLPLADVQAMATVAPNVLAVHDMRPDDVNLLFIKEVILRGLSLVVLKTLKKKSLPVPKNLKMPF